MRHYFHRFSILSLLLLGTPPVAGAAEMYNPSIPLLPTQVSELSPWYSTTPYYSNTYTRNSRPVFRSTTRRLQPGSSSSSYSSTTSTSTPVVSSRRYFSPSYRRPSGSASRTTGTLVQTTSDSRVTATVRPYRQRQDIQTVDESTIDVFQIGFAHGTITRSTQFQEPILIEGMKFRLSSLGEGSVDFRRYAIDINGQDITFEEDGTLSIDLDNVRLSRGSSTSFDVRLRVDDADAVPHFYRRFTLSIEDITAQTEYSLADVPVRIIGTTISNDIVWNPIPNVNQSPVFSGRPIQIFGRSLSTGESAFVASLDFQANYDDIYIEDITVRDSLSGGAIDTWVSSVRLYDQDTGQIIATSRFTNGVAHFNLNRNQFVIPRNSTRRMAVEVVVSSYVSPGISGTDFQIDIDADDVTAFGIGSGRELSASEKNFSTSAQTFSVSHGGGISISTATISQPYGFGATGNLEQVFRFSIRNNGDSGINLARVSFDIDLGGVSLVNGASSLQLKETDARAQSSGQVFGTTSYDSSGKAVFDASSPIYIGGKREAYFVLSLQMEDIAPIADNDFVALKLLGDSSSNRGTLTQVRSAGANFIWADSNNTGSDGYSSGYLLPGLPTNTISVYRDGRR